MTSAEIRQSFLDFFKSKGHTIVPSASLMPDSPGLLFTNAGMNQFVPIFLNQRAPDVDQWPGAIPGKPTRAADTQKCIRAGGKHNDLEDVGLDTYHHTFFEMLGNWSFGDYFKNEAIEWAWELLTDRWHFPPGRLYATVFCPYLDQLGWKNRWAGDLREAVTVARAILEGASYGGSGGPDGAGGTEAFKFSDVDAAIYWAIQFIKAKEDPLIHIVPGNRKDNFWMMGETGPCGPCSEIHVDLTPAGDTKGTLVNKADARCMEIWNLVFIQFNANIDGTLSPLPAKHVDTGMGFERVTSIIQGTNEFKDFANAKISNYDTDIFRPIFDALEKLSEQHYSSTLPTQLQGDDVTTRVGRAVGVILPEQVPIDIAFRVIADHIRTLSFSIADGILPGNTDRNYVLRRILRRAVRYGRNLGFRDPFLYKLVEVLAKTMAGAFPVILARKNQVQETIRAEEEAFNKTLDKGIRLFDKLVDDYRIIGEQVTEKISNLEEVARVDCLQIPVDAVNKMKAGLNSQLLAVNAWMPDIPQRENAKLDSVRATLQKALHLLEDRELQRLITKTDVLEWDDQETSVRSFPLALDRSLAEITKAILALSSLKNDITKAGLSGEAAFLLYDTYGFPLDLTELMARERGLTVDTAAFEKLMDEQRARARAAQKKEIISASNLDTSRPTDFVGFDRLAATATILAAVNIKDKTAVTLDASPLYAEMGGQVGDTGEIHAGGKVWQIVNTQKTGNTFLHFLAGPDAPEPGAKVELRVHAPRRAAIQRHHTVTHLLHWALHEVVSHDATQKGSYVGPEKLTFDFSSAALTPAQVADVEKLVNEHILDNAGVTWSEVPYGEIKGRKEVMQFFGEKYGDIVRVVQIGGRASGLDGYSMELCGGTHTRATGEIGLFRILSESAVAAGIRRIEAVAGLRAYEKAREETALISALAGKVHSPPAELEKKLESLLSQQKDMEKQLKSARQKQAAETARALLKSAEAKTFIIENLGAADGDFLQAVADALKGQFKGVVVLGGSSNEAVSLVATVSSDFTAKFQAGKIIQAIAPLVGGKGGGKPDNARGGGKDASKLGEALNKAREIVGAA